MVPVGSSPRVRGKRRRERPHGPAAGLIPARAGKTNGRTAAARSEPAHPRACGENGTAGAGATRLSGSSPRVRGKRHPRRRRGHEDRLIPARAGKTTRGRENRLQRWAHPHACGENVLARHQLLHQAGSSPRVRGKRRGCPCSTGGWRLIPARAGKTPPTRGAPPPASAHPRACGENPRRRDIEVLSAGSSPRVRGKLEDDVGRPPAVRLIPARAGKTSPALIHPSAVAAHPRACGENSTSRGRIVPSQGSSPRVRGKREQFLAEGGFGGLIPARAGKTVQEGVGVESAPGSSPRVRGKHHALRNRGTTNRLIPARAGKTKRVAASSMADRAHPRACGENHIGWGPMRGHEGSSPRVRGKLPGGVGGPGFLGLIPARAGKTWRTPSASSTRPAHPRACGENHMATGPMNASIGSSPRVRGKRGRGHVGRRHRRLIPARAGKTPA